MTGFPPVHDHHAGILILGSFPGQASLVAGRYYAHPRNLFWPLLCDILGEQRSESYAARLEMLVRHRIALWDVAAACERPGSADSAIRQAGANDFAALFAACPHLRRVLFNGRTAAALWKKLVGSPPWCTGVTFRTLPSTSPAHAALDFSEKRLLWARALADDEEKGDASG